MKLLRKLLWLGATICMALGFGCAVVSCDDTPASQPGPVTPTPPPEEDENTEFMYRVSVQNVTGFGFKNVTVNLSVGNNVISKTTNSAGNATFYETDVATAGEYVVELENLPAGYDYDKPNLTYKTANSAGSKMTIEIKPTGLLEGTPPNGHGYPLKEVGGVMYDFNVKLANNTEYKLSKILETKKLVMLNFWYEGCMPCENEFPGLHTALSLNLNTVSVLTISTRNETNQDVLSFQKNNNYDHFNMASSQDDSTANSLMGIFNVSATPHSILIDRYGVVVYNHVGSVPDAETFRDLFDRFTGEDYQPTVIAETNSSEGGDNTDSGVTEMVKPNDNILIPSGAEIESVLASDPSASGFSFRFQPEEGLEPGDANYDDTSWPWHIDENKDYIYASNKNIHYSRAVLYAEVDVMDGDVLTFDYRIDTEANCDILYLIVDGEIVNKYSGHFNEWQKTYAYMFREETTDKAYKHVIAFVFQKDYETTVGGDVVEITNLRIEKESALQDTGASIFRQAATFLNTDADAPTQYKNYVDVVYNEEDEYYHVGTKTGPILYANLMTASRWNKSSFWLLAYNDYVVGNGMNYHSAVESFAWEAAQVTSVNGYAPVTRDLKYLLDIAARYVSFEQNWAGPYHDKEWLELCVYWEYYGTDVPEDPMAGISFTSAIKMHAAEAGCAHEDDCDCANSVSVPYALNPRGFKYKFKPETSGAYKVYSVGKTDPIVFLVDQNRTTQLGYWDNKIFTEYITDAEGNDVSDDNFEFYWYFEAGRTYYMLFTTYLDQLATYDVYIEYLGESYTYLENAAVGPYSANLNTFELFLPDAIEYERGEDGYYYHKKADGTLGGKIYLDVARPTAFFTNNSLWDIADKGLDYDKEKRALFVDGEDYTEYFYKLAYDAMKQTEKQGFVAVNDEVFEKLNKITMSSKYDGIETSWLLLCYYEKTLG